MAAKKESEFTLKTGSIFVVRNPKAFIRFSKRNIPHYESSERTFMVEETSKTIRFYELRRGQKPKYHSSVRRGENAIQEFNNLLEFSSETEQISTQKRDTPTATLVSITKRKTAISNVIRKSAPNTMCQLLCVCSIYDRKVKKTFRYIGYSKKFPQADLNNAHTMDNHREVAIYSAIGSYARDRKIGKFSYKSNRFIVSIDDTRIIYRRLNLYDRRYPKKLSHAEQYEQERRQKASGFISS